jgi:hypothetical protein
VQQAKVLATTLIIREVILLSADVVWVRYPLAEMKPLKWREDTFNF